MSRRRVGLLKRIVIAFGLAMIAISSLNILVASEAISYIFYDYSAKDMSFDRKNGITVFEGDAKLKVRDSGDYLNADKITVYRDIKTGELIKMEAVGNVDMSQEGMKATCQKAIFYEKEERIEMEGTEDKPAVVDDDKNRMEAPAITFFRKEDRLEASGNVSGHVTIAGREEEVKEETKEEDKN